MVILHYLDNKMKSIITVLMLFISSLLYSQTACNDTILVPNAFTPTYQKNNKFFPYLNNNYEDYKIIIYNRLGQLIFEGKEWDGTYKGNLCDPGVYVWNIIAYNTDCQKSFYGHILLIK